MSVDQFFFHHLWQKISFQIVHKTTIWVLLVFLIVAGTSWQLGIILDKHNNREREANMARRVSLGYIIITVTLWLFSFIMSS